MSVHAGTRAATDNLVLTIDAENERSWSYNVHPYPLDIGSWPVATGGNNVTTSRDLTFTATTQSPVGGVPLSMIVTGTDPHIYSTSTYLAPAAIGQTWTVSVYARANTAISGELLILGLNSANNFIEAPSGAINITTEWQRFSYTHTFTNALTTGIAIRLDGPNAGTASTIWWDGLQVERNSSATDFNPTQNVNGNRVYGLKVPPVVSCTLVGSTSHNNVTPKSLSTNATTVTQQSYLTPSSAISFADGSSYSMEFWVKLRSGALSTFHSLAGQLGTTQWLMLYANNTTGDNWFIRYRENPGQFRDSSVVTSINIQNTWAHVAVTVDGSRNLRFYVNGIFLNSVAATSTAFNVAAIMGGYNDSGNFYPLQGSMGACRLYSKTLSGDEVRSNFFSLRARFGI